MVCCPESDGRVLVLDSFDLFEECISEVADLSPVTMAYVIWFKCFLFKSLALDCIERLLITDIWLIHLRLASFAHLVQRVHYHRLLQTLDTDVSFDLPFRCWIATERMSLDTSVPFFENPVTDSVFATL